MKIALISFVFIFFRRFFKYSRLLNDLSSPLLSLSLSFSEKKIQAEYRRYSIEIKRKQWFVIDTINSVESL